MEIISNSNATAESSPNDISIQANKRTNENLHGTGPSTYNPKNAQRTKRACSAVSTPGSAAGADQRQKPPSKKPKPKPFAHYEQTQKAASTFVHNFLRSFPDQDTHAQLAAANLELAAAMEKDLLKLQQSIQQNRHALHLAINHEKASRRQMQMVMHHEKQSRGLLQAVARHHKHMKQNMQQVAKELDAQKQYMHDTKIQH